MEVGERSWDGWGTYTGHVGIQVRDTSAYTRQVNIYGIYKWALWPFQGTQIGPRPDPCAASRRGIGRSRPSMCFRPKLLEKKGPIEAEPLLYTDYIDVYKQV
jgi:hypothetical protein